MKLTLFESVQKAYTRPEHIINADWATVAEFLMQHNPANSKEEVPLFNLWQFKTENYELGRRRIYENQEPTEKYEEIQGTIRRCKNNSVALHGLVLDYDGTRKFDEAVDVISESCIEAVFYTTFRHTEEKNKFRVVIPFKNAITKHDLTRKKKAIQETFPEVDHASFSESQCFYLHSGPIARTHWCKGVMLDPDWFEDEEIIEHQPRPASTEFSGNKESYKQKLIDSLLTCSGLHYASDRSHLGVLTLVALCKSAGMSYEEYDTVCWHMAAADSSLKNAAQRKSAWLGWNPHSGITTEVREKFIKAYNGSSKFDKHISHIDLLKIKLQKLKEKL